jgi:hypothetical protein
MGNPTFGLPGTQLAIDTKTGGWVSTWYQWAVRISQLSAERPIAAITVGASPFVYTSSTIGNLYVAGGTVSAVVLARSSVTLAAATNRFIPMAANDTVTITYSVLPTVTFVPDARG